MSERMYRDTRTWNPFVGCEYDCVYCKPSFQSLMRWNGTKRNCLNCQTYMPHIHRERLDRISSDKTIFALSFTDISFVPQSFMLEILMKMRNDTREGRVWLLQSKNPQCLEQYLKFLPDNTFLLTTLETNKDCGYLNFSKAPKPSERAKAFQSLDWTNKIVTVEPIMDFDHDKFVDMIVQIKPKVVFVGYNSHPLVVRLPEPNENKTFTLIDGLKGKGLTVLPKDLHGLAEKYAYRDFFEGSEKVK